MYPNKEAQLRMQALLTTHEDDVHDFLSVFAPDLAKFKIPELRGGQSWWDEEKLLKGILHQIEIKF